MTLIDTARIQLINLPGYGVEVTNIASQEDIEITPEFIELSNGVKLKVRLQESVLTSYFCKARPYIKKRCPRMETQVSEIET